MTKEKVGLLLAIIVTIIFLFLPLPGSVEFAGETITLSKAGMSMLALLTVLVIIFITEALPIGATVAIVYAWLIFFGVMNVEEAQSLFSHDAGWFLIGALMMATILIKYKIHRRLMVLIMKVVGTKTRNLVFGIVTFSAISAAFIADHLIAAMLLPIAITIIHAEGGFKKNPKLAKLLLFSLAFGASIGGIGTPSGGGRNVVMLSLIKEFGNVTVGYGSWMVMAFPLVILLIPVVTIVLLLRWKPEVTDLSGVMTNIKDEMQMRKMGKKEWGTVVIFLFILALFIFNSHRGIGMIAMFGTLLFLIFGLAKWKDYQGINWNIPLLYFGAIGFGKALQVSGAAKWVAAKLLTSVGSLVPLKGMGLTMFQTLGVSLTSQIMADGPTVATIGPIFVESSVLTGLDPVVSGVAMAIASAFTFMFILGTPANAIVYGTGYLKVKDFLTTGIFIFISALVLLWLLIHFWWGWLDVGVTGFH